MGNQGSNPRGRALYSHAQGAWWQVLFSPRSQGKRRVPPLMTLSSVGSISWKRTRGCRGDDQGRRRVRERKNGQML